MGALKKHLLAGFLAVALCIGLVAPATANQPLKVNISNYYAKPKIAVAKKLKITVSCNRDCGVNVTGTLRMPGGKSSWNASRSMTAGSIWFITYKLTNFGVRYLRQNFRKSRYIVRVAATDLESGQKSVKTRTFRFSR